MAECLHQNFNRVTEPPGYHENTVITQFVDECGDCHSMRPGVMFWGKAPTTPSEWYPPGTALREGLVELLRSWSEASC